MAGRAFVLRMNPAGIPRAAVGRDTNQITIGWGKCGAELLNQRLDRSAFAWHVHRTYNPTDTNRVTSGNSAGQLWRFIRAMSAGDLVVVPEGVRLHIAEVVGDPTYDPIPEHWAYRRAVRWLTPRAGVRRSDAGERLRSGLRSQITCFDVSPMLEDIRVLAR